MPFQHLQLLAVLETDDVVRRDRLSDRHGSLRRLVAPIPGYDIDLPQRAVNRVDDIGYLRRRQRVIADVCGNNISRSEEHTSELQSLMRNSYDVFCLKKKKHINDKNENDKLTR